MFYFWPGCPAIEASFGMRGPDVARLSGLVVVCHERYRRRE